MAVNGIDPEAIVNSPERGFLGHLAPSVLQYPYQGKDQYVQYFERMCNQLLDNPRNTPSCFLVTSIPEPVAERDFLSEIEGNSPFSRWISYDATLDLLLVRMCKSPAHEFAAGVFDTILFEAIEPTGMTRHHLDPFNGTTCYSAEGRKEADRAWLPVRVPRGRSRYWPSAVLEVAYSETQSKLLSDARFWLRGSGGDVGVVFALNINRVQPRITIEQWGPENGRHRREQVVTIMKRGQNTRVDGAPLVVDFREKDIEIDEDKFAFLADRIWTAQDEEEERKETDRRAGR
ncbi:hypothetical protein BJX76DRAFT_346239 [Aspergillus varians]